MVLGNLIYKCTYELYNEFNNITRSSLEMIRIIRHLIKPKLSVFQIAYISVIFSTSFVYQKLWETMFQQCDFCVVVIVTIVMLTALSKLVST